MTLLVNLGAMLIFLLAIIVVDLTNEWCSYNFLTRHSRVIDTVGLRPLFPRHLFPPSKPKMCAYQMQVGSFAPR
jgi:hypothetical protein